MSPALSNDCEVDSQVKKPLLHDLFDLLGLPVRNTGLSLFTMWSTQKKFEKTDNDTTKNFQGHLTKERKFAPESMSVVDDFPNTLHLVIFYPFSSVITFYNF